MPALNLKPNHKVIKDYYHSLEEFDHYGVSHESAVRSAFQTLLEGCGKQRGWKLIMYRGLTPPKFMPISGTHKRIERTRKLAAHAERLLPLILAHRIYNFLWFPRDLIQTPYESSLFSFYESLLIMWEGFSKLNINQRAPISD